MSKDKKLTQEELNNIVIDVLKCIKAKVGDEPTKIDLVIHQLKNYGYVGRQLYPIIDSKVDPKVYSCTGKGE